MNYMQDLGHTSTLGRSRMKSPEKKLQEILCLKWSNQDKVHESVEHSSKAVDFLDASA